MKNHIEWLDRTTRGDSNREIARQENISDATLSRQKRAGELSSDLVIRIAEAYIESPVIALVDLGFMSSKWITEPGVVTALSRASDEELTDELLRRLNLLDKRSVDGLTARHSNKNTPAVQPISDDELADAICKANEQPQAAHTDDGIEYTEPESPYEEGWTSKKLQNSSG